MKHKFNIGDKVKVLKGFYVGMEGKVIEFHKTQIGKRKGLSYLVRHDDNTVPDGLYWTNELALISGVHEASVPSTEVFYSKYIPIDLLPESEKPTLEERRKHEEEYNAFMDNYRKQHRVCPKCGSKHYSTTLVGFAYHSEHPETYKDLNSVTCYDCGWRGVRHDLVPEKDNNK